MMIGRRLPLLLLVLLLGVRGLQSPPALRAGGAAWGDDLFAETLWTEDEAQLDEQALRDHEVITSVALTGSERLEEDGVCLARGVLRRETAFELREFVLSQRDRIVREGSSADELSSVLSPENRYDVRLPMRGPVVEAAAQVAARLGVSPGSELWELAAIVSDPGAPPQVVHSDTSYDDEPCLLTCFVALQDVRRDMGPTLFFPGTHNEEEAHDRAELADRLEFLSEREARVALLERGDASVYDGRVLHAGGPNTSKTSRVLFYATFLSEGADRTLGNAPSILPELRGTLRLGDLLPYSS